MASGRSKNYYAADISKSGPAESSTDVSKIVDEFHCLYNEKIVKLQMMNPGCTELKINALEEWVRDLTEQNRMLVKTVENLEKNALDRVDTLDSVLRKKSAENESRSCKDCPDLNQRCDKMKAELENTKYLLSEKECYMQNYIKQIEDMKKALSKQSAVTNQATQKSIDSNWSDQEDAMVDLKSQLCINEKVLKARTEEMECMKFKLAEMEQMNQMLQSEAEKGRCIPKLQEAIGLLRDAVKEKDCILEQYHQEINCLKSEMCQAEDQDSKIYELEDSLKYYEQCLKQKDLMLEKLKAHIKQLRQCLSQLQCQKQVQSLKATSESAVFYDCENQENGEVLNLKEQISTLGGNLSETLIQLNSMWGTMKECELENGDSTFRLTKEIQSSIEKEHNQLLQVNNEMQYITCQINELTSLGVDNDYLLHCIEKCLIESLNMISKQKCLMGIPESSSGSLNDNTNSPLNVKYIKCIEAILGDSVSLLQQLKKKLLTWDDSTSKININKTNEINNTVNNLISNRQNVLDKLCLVNVSQDEISKKIFKKFSDFDNTLGIHQNIVHGLKYYLNHFIFNDFISKNSKQDIVALQICETANEVPLKDLKQTSVDVSNSDINFKKIRSLRKNRLSRSSPSIGEEYQNDVLGNVHMKIAHLQQIALALNKEIKSYLKEVLLREDKTREFVCESQDLNKTLSTLNKELCASEKVLVDNRISLSVPSLQSTLRQAQTEVELLLCKVDDFTNYKDMYDMNRSKMEQEIQELQKDMFTVVSDIMDAIKVSQDYDNNLLNSYRTKIQSYREKVEQLEKHLTTSIDQNEVEEKDEEEDLICKLTDKIEKYQSEVEKLKNSINIVKKDKETVEMENQQVMEELQAKICTLQAALQNEAQQHQPIVRMHAYIKQQKEEYTNKLNQESDESALNKQEVNILNEMLKQNQVEIRRLKSQVFTLQSVKERLQSTVGMKNPPEQNNEFKLVKMENIRIKKELEQTIGLNYSHCKNNEELREKLKQVQDEAYTLRARALKQKEQLTYLIEECKQFKIDKEQVENEKEDLVYEITNLKEELASVRGSECKIAAEMIKNSQKICQLVHEKENLEKLLEDKVELNKKMENVINELTKECEKLKNENFKIVQQNEVLQFMTHKMEALNEENSEKDKKLEALEHRLKSLMNPYRMEGQDLIKTHENDEDIKTIIRKSVSLEESIDNLEAENVKLCNENMRLKNEIKLLCHVNNDSALSNVPEEEDDDNYKAVLVNKISSYRKKLKTFMQQNWRLIEMVNKLQHINNLLASNKENIKLRRLSVNKEDVTEKFFQTQQIGGDGEMQPYVCY